MTDLNSVIIFAPSQIGKAARIADLIETNRCPEIRAAIHTDVARVRAELITISPCTCLTVLLAADILELELMVDMAPWFVEAAAVIIIVPDHHRKTIALAHRLRPRYIAWPDINYREMHMVLHHIVSRSGMTKESIT